MNIPAKLVAGDSVTWIDRATKDNLGRLISSADWTLDYIIKGSTSANIVGVAEGPGWKTSIASATSLALEPGVYFWQAVASNGSERITIGQGQIEIVANLSQVDEPYDGRSQTKQDLDAVQAAIRSMVSGGAVAEYTIGNRSVKKLSLPDLLMLESRLKARYARERKAEEIANGLGNPNNIFVRFS